MNSWSIHVEPVTDNGKQVRIVLADTCGSVAVHATRDQAMAVAMRLLDAVSDLGSVDCRHATGTRHVAEL